MFISYRKGYLDNNDKLTYYETFSWILSIRIYYEYCTGGGFRGHAPPLEKRFDKKYVQKPANLFESYSVRGFNSPLYIGQNPWTLPKKFLARRGNPYTLILKGITLTKHCIMWLMHNAFQDIL